VEGRRVGGGGGEKGADALCPFPKISERRPTLQEMNKEKPVSFKKVKNCRKGKVCYRTESGTMAGAPTRFMGGQSGVAKSR